MSQQDQTGSAPVASALVAEPGNTASVAASQAGGADAQAAPLGPETFAEMGLSEDVLKALLDMGFSAPLPVQSAVFKLMHDGRDVMVQSRTGSGKTAAFGIPLIERLGKEPASCVEALILAPTRELALQSASECGKIAKYRKLDVVPVYGGAPMAKQIEQLKAGAQIVSGTPGRVLDHLRRGTLKLDGLKVLVLDEADEMLSMGFLEEITEIIKRCPTDRQTVLFSATIPEDIERIGSRYMRTPEKIQLSAGNIGVHTIRHTYYMVSGMGRTRDLQKVLEAERPDSAVIFCNTREDTGLVAEFLRKNGFDAEAISSDLTQKDRERVMTRMKEKDLRFLVATDIAARGIDISDLSHVINYTFPESAEVYVHRTGRTGRAGKSGIAISLISPRELGNFYMLKLTYRIRPEERALPSEEQIRTHKEGNKLDELRALLDKHSINEDSRALARRVMTADEGIDLVAKLVDDFLRQSRVPNVRAVAAVRRDEVAPTPTATIAAAPAPRREPRSAPLASAPAASRPAPTAAAPREDGATEEGRTRRRRRRPGEGRDERPTGTPASHGGARATEGGEKKKGVEGTIDTSSGREFWEAWVDSRDDGTVSKTSTGTSTSTDTTTSTAPVTAERSAPRSVEREPSERPRRGRDRDRRPRGAPVVPDGQARLYLNLGHRDGAEEADVRALLAQHEVAPIELDVMSSHSYMNVNEADADAAITRLGAAMFGERALRCERAKP